MKYFSYVVTRDYGFAPNPYRNVCTLATCKPDIRKAARVGDWIFGTGSVRNVGNNRLIYAMKVEEILTFNDYFRDERYQYKKPDMQGSIAGMYGDNIYLYEEDVWRQLDSHHSHPNGVANPVNVNRDTKSRNVLLSTNFYYFGERAILIPPHLLDHIVKKRQGFRYINENAAKKLICHVKANSKRIGMNGLPCKLGSGFDRFKGS